MARAIWNNFNGGLANSIIDSRYNLEKYSSLSRVLKNFIPQLHGSAKRRDGSLFVAEIANATPSSRLIPFSFNIEEKNNFAIVINNLNITVFSATQEVASFASPYLEEDIADISYSQIGDVIYLAHKNYPLHKIERRGSAPFYEWQIVEVILNASLTPPKSVTVSFKAGPTSSGQTVAPIDYELRYKVTAVDANGVESIASEHGSALGRYATDWIAGDSVTVSFPTVYGAVEYNIYKETAGYYGYVGTVQPLENQQPEKYVDKILIDGVVYDPSVYQATIQNTETSICSGYGDIGCNTTIEQGNIFVTQTGKSYIYNDVMITQTTITNTYILMVFDEEQSRNVETRNTWMILDYHNGSIEGEYIRSEYTEQNLGNNALYPSGTFNGHFVEPVFEESIIVRFLDQNYEPDLNATPKEDWNPFENGNNPSLVGFHNQRLVLGKTKNSPTSFYMSRAGDYENFRKSRPLQSDDPVEYALATGSIDEIQWLVSFGDLLLGTSGAEYKVSGAGGTGSPITALEVSISPQSFYGSANVKPLLLGNGILHVQQYSSRVRDMFYSLELDGYSGNDLTILAPDIFASFRLLQWAFVQIPNSTIWCVRSDGKIYTLTYMKEQNVYAWAEQVTLGNYISVCTLQGTKSNVLFTIVERELNGEKKYYLEKFSETFDETKGIEDALYLDSAVLYEYEEATNITQIPEHLEASNIMVLADGIPYEKPTIENGKIVLPVPAKKVYIGYPYESMLSTFPFNVDTQQGSTLGIDRTLSTISVKVHRSVTGKYGNEPIIDEMLDFKLSPEYYDAPYSLYSGLHDVNIISPSRDTESICLGQILPLPLEIQTIIASIHFTEETK